MDHRILRKSPYPEVSRPKPGGPVAEIARGTKFDLFGNSRKKEIGERVSNLNNTLEQTAQTPVEKIVESRTETTSEDRLDNRFGPRTKAGSVSRSRA